MTVGAVGAALLGALSGGVSNSSVMEVVVTALVAAVAWGLLAVGSAAVARAGVGAAWAGLVLSIVQVLGVGIIVAMMKSQSLTPALAMAPLGFLGIAVTVLAAKTFPLPEVRLLTGMLFIGAVVGSGIALGGTLLSITRLIRLERPAWPIDQIAFPAATTGLVLWAAYLVFLAFPPEPAPRIPG